MKLTITKKSLVKIAERAARVASVKSPTPIKNNVAVVADGTRLTVSGMDEYIAASTSGEARIERAGSACFNASNMLKIIKSLPEGDVSLTVAPNFGMEIKAGRSRFKLPGMSSAEYPAFPKLPEEWSSARGTTLTRIINAVRSMMSTDESRAHLAGVYFTSTSDGMVSAVATDGHRLSVAIGDESLGLAALVPARGVSEMLAICDGQETVDVGTSGGILFVRTPDSVVGVRLADDQFPPYQKIIPQGYKTTADVDREMLVSAIKRASLVTSVSGALRLAMSDGSITVESENPESGECSEAIDCTWHGESLVIGANARYLIDALNAIPHDTVRIALGRAIDPVLITGVDSKDALHVIMPMRV